MISFRQLRYYVAIVDTGSYSEAAARLHVAQSALSRQVKLLEEAVGAVLLERNTRRIETTPAGRAFYQDARLSLEGLEAMAGRAREVERGEQGTVELLHSSSVPLNGAWLAALRAHLAVHDGVRLSISTASSEQQAADIQHGRADIGLARAPVLRQLPDVAAQVLREERLVLVVPAAHPLAGRASARVGDLRHERFVSLPHPARGGLSYRVVELCRAAGFFPEAAQVVSRKATQLQLVGMGYGVALVPASMAAQAPSGVARVGLEGECATQVVVQYRRNASALVQGVLDALAGSAQG